MPNKNKGRITLKEIGTDIIKLLDPTGISSWGDAKGAISRAADNPNIETISDAVIESAGALPFIGKGGKVLKLVKPLIKNGNKVVSTTAKVINATGNLMQNASHAKKYKVVRDAEKVNMSLRAATKGPKVVGDLDMYGLGGTLTKNLAYLAAKRSMGDQSGLSFILNMDGRSAPNYYGTFNPITSKKYDTNFVSSDKKADVNALRLYGKDDNFERYEGKKLVVNGDTLNDVNYYTYPIYTKDAVTINKDALSKINPNQIYRILEDVYNRNNMSDKNILDYQNASVVFKDGVAKFFDYTDNGGPIGRMLNFATRPTYKYPNSGNPIFVQELPIKEGETDNELKDIAVDDLRQILKNNEQKHKYGGMIHLKTI